MVFLVDPILRNALRQELLNCRIAMSFESVFMNDLWVFGCSTVVVSLIDKTNAEKTFLNFYSRRPFQRT